MRDVDMPCRDDLQACYQGSGIGLSATPIPEPFSQQHNPSLTKPNSQTPSQNI